MQNVEARPQVFSDRKPQQRHWLEMAEYASLAGSVMGAIAAAVSEQILFAATPLTVTLGLNLLNRQRFEQQIRQQNQAAIADVHQVVQSLYDQIPHQKGDSIDLNPITESLSQLRQVTKRLENQVLTEQDWEVMNVRFLMLEETIDELRNVTLNLQQHWDTNTDFSEIQAAIAQLKRLANNPASDVTLLHHEIEQLQGQVQQLHKQNQETFKPYLSRLIRAVKQLQQTNSSDCKPQLNLKN